MAPRKLPLYSLLVTLAAAGCATSPVKNERLEQFSPGYGYRLDAVEADDTNSDSLFVILTFSGGGTRAAAFAYFGTTPLSLMILAQLAISSGTNFFR